MISKDGEVQGEEIVGCRKSVGDKQMTLLFRTTISSFHQDGGLIAISLAQG